MLENLSAWLRREQRLATATPEDVPKGGTAATSRHLSERFTYFLRNQDDEGEFFLICEMYLYFDGMP